MTSERANNDTATKASGGLKESGKTIHISSTLRLPIQNKGLLTSRAQLIQRGMNEADSLGHYLPTFQKKLKDP